MSVFVTMWYHFIFDEMRSNGWRRGCPNESYRILWFRSQGKLKWRCKSGSCCVEAMKPGLALPIQIVIAGPLALQVRRLEALRVVVGSHREGRGKTGIAGARMLCYCRADGTALYTCHVWRTATPRCLHISFLGIGSRVHDGKADGICSRREV